MEQRRSEKFIKLVIYLYLVLPVMIFFAGWLKWQMSGQVLRGSVGAYQADERAGVARLCWRISGR